MKNRGFIKYLLALLLFGSNGIVAGLIDLSSLQIVLLRTLIGSCLLIAILIFSGGKFTFFKYKNQSVFLAASGIAMGASWMFLYEAYSRIGVSISSLLYYCGPVIVMILSPFIFKEKVTVHKIVGFATVIIGVFLINENAAEKSADIFGIICGLLSAVTYSAMVICNKKAKDIVGLENSALQLAVSFLTVAVFFGIKQGYAMEIQQSDILPILTLGILNTGIGCYMYFSSIGKLSVQTVAVCGYIESLSAVLFSVLILKEALMPLQAIGAVLIIGGAMFGELMSNRNSNK